MSEGEKYIGNELELFARAINWKRYWISKVKPFLKGSILEVGAGIGTNTGILLEGKEEIKKWICLEPDRELAEQIERNIHSHMLHKTEVIPKYLDQTNLKEKFDGILYIDVIEHIEKDYEEINRAKEYLKTGGVLIILVPALDSLYSKFDEAIGHYRRYNKKSLLDTVGSKEMKIIKLHYLDSVGMSASFFNKWFLKQDYPTAKQIVFWDSWMVPVSKFSDVISDYRIGKSLLGIWRKEDIGEDC